MNLHGLIEAAGGGRITGPNSVLLRGIGRSARNRSVAVALTADGKLLAHDHSRGEHLLHLRWAEGVLGVKPCTPIRSRQVQPAPLAAPVNSRKRAVDLWRECAPIDETLGAAYLRSRGVEPGRDLRWHPRCPFGTERVGCLVALVRDIRSNEPIAIHRTALDRAGRKIGRMALGTIAGGAVKLTDDAEVTGVLGIGEGIETTLSLRRLPGLSELPVWSLICANGIEKFPQLAGIEVIWVAADNDESGTGQRVSQVLADRLTADGTEVIVVTPNTIGADLNDGVVS